jgi:hypothetical protein
MSDLLQRAVCVAPLVVALPFGIPRLRGRLARAVVALVLLGASLATDLDEPEAWVILTVTVATALAMPGAWYDTRRLGPATAAVALAAFTVVVVDASQAGDALADVGRSRDVTFAVAGWLSCVFVGGAIIGWIMHPFATRIQGRSPGMEDAGRYIGWLERTLLYGLILLGSAEGAAIVIAAKSIARFPSFKEEEFAEYYLIGSLLSLVIAAGCAVVVRACLGLHVLS